MFDSAKTTNQPGDLVRASDLNRAARLANRGGNLTKGNNANGAVLADFQGGSPKAPTAIIVVRMQSDCIPDNNSESGTVNSTAIENAIRQVWNDVTNTWSDDQDAYINVTATRLPLLKDTVLPVAFHRGSGRWVPLEEPCEGIVEVFSTEVNDYGYYNGTLEEPNLVDKNFRVIRSVYVLDGNDPNWPSV